MPLVFDQQLGLAVSFDGPAAKGDFVGKKVFRIDVIGEFQHGIHASPQLHGGTQMAEMGRCGKSFDRFVSCGDPFEKFIAHGKIIFVTEFFHGIGHIGGTFQIGKLSFDKGFDPFCTGSRHLGICLVEKAFEFAHHFRIIPFGKKGLIEGKFAHFAHGAQVVAPPGFSFGENAEALP